MFEVKTLKDGSKKIAPRTKTSAITDDTNKSLDAILSEKANSTDVPSKVSQLTNDTGFITNAALANYPNNTQMNVAINSHHDSTKQDKLAAQTPYTNVGSKSKIPKITTNELGQVTNVEEVAIEAQQANLSQNLTYANDNDTSIVTNVSDDLLLSDDETYIEAKKSTDVISNGLLSSVEKTIARFSKDYFSIKNTNEVSLDISKVLADALLLDGSSILPTHKPVLNDINTGIACSYDTLNLPIANTDTIVLCGSAKNGIHIQVAFNSQKIFFRSSSDGVTWNNWVEYYTGKQDKLTFATTDFNVTNNNVALNPTKFTDYLLKSDAPGYNDILTSAGAETTYVAKNDAPGYDDILTKANAAKTYETITNASTKQDKLVSGTNIKTINNESLLGSGNIKSGSPSTVYSNIAVNVTPVALSSYCVWDTQQLYGYKATIAINGLTANSLIQNIIMTDTLLASIGYIATTGTNSLTFYTQDNTPLSGMIITLVTSEVV